MTGSRERADWARVDMGAGDSLHLLDACFDTHHLAPHAHEELTGGVTLGGSEIIDYRGDRVRSDPGSIVVLMPQEAHTGRPATGCEGYAYRSMYPRSALLTEGTTALPFFRDPVVHDPGLAAALTRAHTALSIRPDRLEAESRLPWLLTALARRHGTGVRTTRDRVPGARTVAEAVRDRLADELTAPPSLAALAAELGLSRYQLLRAFRDTYGMPPYAWLAQYRVLRARALLDTGHRPAEAAALAGFADQAHLTRWFRRVTGSTPAAYRNSVQDRSR
ncbi:AraC family transcriptional regulator [Streptomyces sp. NPDC060194]|uniref:AraC family transcriptional regulator n=1 Tax=Streptomyces sp. NPDC060194 TaxID=3347069 RepID=UPI00364E9052